MCEHAELSSDRPLSGRGIQRNVHQPRAGRTLIPPHVRPQSPGTLRLNPGILNPVFLVITRPVAARVTELSRVSEVIWACLSLTCLTEQGTF